MGSPNNLLQMDLTFSVSIWPILCCHRDLFWPYCNPRLGVRLIVLCTHKNLIHNKLQETYSSPFGGTFPFAARSVSWCVAALIVQLGLTFL
jgi:hypothetical protein